MENEIIRLFGFYGQITRWGVYDEKGLAPTLTAAMGMGGGHIPMVISNADQSEKRLSD